MSAIHAAIPALMNFMPRLQSSCRGLLSERVRLALPILGIAGRATGGRLSIFAVLLVLVELLLLLELDGRAELVLYLGTLMVTRAIFSMLAPFISHEVDSIRFWLML